MNLNTFYFSQIVIGFLCQAYVADRMILGVLRVNEYKHQVLLGGFVSCSFNGYENSLNG